MPRTTAANELRVNGHSKQQQREPNHSPLCAPRPLTAWLGPHAATVGPQLPLHSLARPAPESFSHSDTYTPTHTLTQPHSPSFPFPTFAVFLSPYFLFLGEFPLKLTPLPLVPTMYEQGQDVRGLPLLWVLFFSFSFTCPEWAFPCEVRWLCGGRRVCHCRSTKSCFCTAFLPMSSINKHGKLKDGCATMTCIFP